jgi:hypothetical protein
VLNYEKESSYMSARNISLTLDHTANFLSSTSVNAYTLEFGMQIARRKEKEPLNLKKETDVLRNQVYLSTSNIRTWNGNSCSSLPYKFIFTIFIYQSYNPLPANKKKHPSEEINTTVKTLNA